MVGGKYTVSAFLKSATDSPGSVVQKLAFPESARGAKPLASKAVACGTVSVADRLTVRFGATVVPLMLFLSTVRSSMVMSWKS